MTLGYAAAPEVRRQLRVRQVAVPSASRAATAHCRGRRGVRLRPAGRQLHRAAARQTWRAPTWSRRPTATTTAARWPAVARRAACSTRPAASTAATACATGPRRTEGGDLGGPVPATASASAAAGRCPATPTAPTTPAAASTSPAATACATAARTTAPARTIAPRTRTRARPAEGARLQHQLRLRPGLRLLRRLLLQRPLPTPLDVLDAPELAFALRRTRRAIAAVMFRRPLSPCARPRPRTRVRSANGRAIFFGECCCRRPVRRRKTAPNACSPRGCGGLQRQVTAT